jgi:sec-independent protein translocase protein TatB
MNLFGVGPLEIGLVAIIAVIVLGPERIPEVAVQVARAVRQLRSYATSATSEMRKELDELTREYEDVRKELKEVRDSVRKDVTSVTDEVSRKLLDEPIIEPGGEPPPKGGRPADDEVSPDPGQKTD